MSLKDKEQRKASNKKYREKNKEKIKASNKRYYEKNKEKKAAYDKKHHEKNKEKRNAQCRDNRRRHTEINQRIIDEGRWDEHIKELHPTGMKSCSLENGKERSINHFSMRVDSVNGFPPYCKGCSAYMGAKKRHKKRFPDQEMISREDFVELFYAEECYLCGRSNEYNSVDRKESNIGYTKDNVATCCWICNNMKGARSLNELVEHCRLIVENNPELGVNVPNIKVKDRVEERKSHLVTIKFP